MPDAVKEALATVTTFPEMPCEPTYEYAEDGCRYCIQHEILVCKTCHRHAVEDDTQVGPGEPFTCPVHGLIARMGHP